MLDQLKEEAKRVNKGMGEMREEEKKVHLQRMEEILEESRGDSATRQQRLTSHLETLERRLVEDELARTIRAEKERGSFVSPLEDQAAEEEEEDHIPLAQRINRKTKANHEVTSAPTSVSPVLNRKRNAFGKYIREIVTAIEQPEALLEQASTKELLDKCGKELVGVRKARRMEARK